LTELKFEQGRRRDLERERAELDGAERFAAPSHEVRKAEISVALSDLSAAPRRLNPAGAAGPLDGSEARFTLKPVTLPDGRILR
jgi:hypothetical protein